MCAVREVLQLFEVRYQRNTLSALHKAGAHLSELVLGRLETADVDIDWSALLSHNPHLKCLAISEVRAVQPFWTGLTQNLTLCMLDVGDLPKSKVCSHADPFWALCFAAERCCGLMSVVCSRLFDGGSGGTSDAHPSSSAPRVDPRAVRSAAIEP